MVVLVVSQISAQIPEDLYGVVLVSFSGYPMSTETTGKRKRKLNHEELEKEFDKLVVLHNNVVNQYNALRLRLLELRDVDETELLTLCHPG